jgi:hypothetical protein
MIESPESSSPIITRAVAAGLRGEYCDPYPLSQIQRFLLLILGLFPQSFARFAITRSQGTTSGLTPTLVENLTSEGLAQERISDYDGLAGTFPCVTLGAALGGATAHLSLALGGPFLPQAFVTSLRGGSPDGDVEVYYQRSSELAKHIARRNPGLMTIQHYDPVHDEWLVRRLNHLRFKLLDLPESYAAFLRRVLQPGGAVCYLDCQARWLRFRVDTRSVFQVGGWGDITPEEYLQGSERLERYCRSVGLKKTDWRLSGFPLETGAESEWGCEPGLDAALEAFCQAEGYRFIRITLPKPHDFSRLAYKAIEHLIREEGRQPGGILIEMFSQFDASAVLKGSLLPVWLVFNTLDSLEFLKTMRSIFPSNRPAFFSPLSTFTKTADLTPWQEWENALAGLDWRIAGARPSHYPADARALVKWAEPLRAWVGSHKQPVRSHLSPEQLSEIAQS